MSLRLGLLAWEVQRGGSVAAWAQRLDREVAQGRRHGAELLAMAEYAPLEAAFGRAPDIKAELARATTLADDLVEAASTVAKRHGVWLMPGTIPFATAAGVVNRAPLFGPDGRVAFQDKHVMTRFEDEEWGVSAGRPPGVFDTPFGRIGIAICFDAEFPALVRVQVEAGAWLVLVPSCTDTMHGFNRVRIAAAARAMENQCFAAVVPTVGSAPWCGALDVNRGYAGVFGPVDRGFPEDGVLARGALDEPGWVFAELDPLRLQSVREAGAVRNHACWPAAPPPARAVAFAAPAG